MNENNLYRYIGESYKNAGLTLKERKDRKQNRHIVIYFTHIFKKSGEYMIKPTIKSLIDAGIKPKRWMLFGVKGDYMLDIALVITEDGRITDWSTIYTARGNVKKYITIDNAVKDIRKVQNESAILQLPRF